MMRGAAVIPADVCLARHCDHYARCAVAVKPPKAMRVRWITPAETGEYCLLFRPQKAGPTQSGDTR